MRVLPDGLGGLRQAGISVFHQVRGLLCLASSVPPGAAGESE